MPTVTAILNDLGHRVKNSRGVWSVQAPRRVTLVLWSDFLSPDKKTYRDTGTANPKAGRRVSHLEFARDHLHGIVSSVIVTRDRTTTVERVQPGSAERGPDWIIVDINPGTRAFTLRKREFSDR